MGLLVLIFTLSDMVASYIDTFFLLYTYNTPDRMLGYQEKAVNFFHFYLRELTNMLGTEQEVRVLRICVFILRWEVI